MTITEVAPTQLPQLSDAATVIDRFAFTIGDQPFVADIGTSEDPRFEEARKIEEDTFVALGDLPEEVKIEFDPLGPLSTVIYLHAGSIDTVAARHNTSGLIGMGRLLPYAPEQGGLKTFVDLGKIAAVQKDGPSNDDANEDTRGRILKALELDSDDVLAIEDEGDRARFITRKVEDRFSTEYGLNSLSGLVDIATLAPDMELEFGDKMVAIEGLLAAMAVHTTDLYHQGRLSHLVQFTAGPLHHYLRDHYRYPVQELFGLEDLSYDSFGNGTGANMVSTPSVLDSQQLVNDVFYAPNPVTEHIGRIASAMNQVSTARLAVV